MSPPPFVFTACLKIANKSVSCKCAINIQLFRERLSEKLHATIPKLKGIVSGFEFTVIQRSLKERHERPWTYLCGC